MRAELGGHDGECCLINSTERNEVVVILMCQEENVVSVQKNIDTMVHSIVHAMYGLVDDHEKAANQPPLQTPTSGTPAADAPVAPPSGAAGR